MKPSVLIAIILLGAVRVHASSYIDAVIPSRNAQNVRTTSNITLTFTEDINPGTLNASTVKVSGSLSGPHVLKPLSYSGSRSIVIDPVLDFSPGETVTLVVTKLVQNLQGDPMPDAFTSQFTVAARVGSGMLQQTSTPGSENQPWAVAPVDIDRNGVMDFAVLNRTAKTVSVIRNYGAGIYLESASTPVGLSPSSFVLADLTGDDTVDCAVANEGANTVTVLVQSGGSFSHPTSFTAGAAPSAIVAADVDDDGAMDLLVANRSSNTVSIFRNNGKGAFTLSSTVPVGVGPCALVTGDFTGDGFIDVAVANEGSNSVTVLVNNGSGTFTAAPAIAVGTGPVSLCAGDFDSDGALDLAVANKAANSVTVLRNDGAGVFTAATLLLGLAAPNTIAAGDMDGDGVCDIIGVGAGVVVFHNQGYFQFFALPSAAAGTSPHGLVLVDCDGDGDLDCVVPNSASSSLSILTNRPAVAVSVSPQTIDFGISRSGLTRQLAASIHNDGVLVPLNVMSVTSSNAVFTTDISAGSAAPLDSIMLTVSFKPADVKTYFDSITILTNDPMRPAIKLYVKAVGGLVVLTTAPASNTTAASGMQPADVVFNGTLDPTSVRLSTMKVFGTMSGLHTGTYAVDNVLRKAEFSPAVRFLTGERVVGVCTDSITATNPSIRLFNGFSWQYGVLPHLGSEHYTVDRSYTTGASPYAIAAGDFNRDGYPDLAVVNSGDNTVSVFINDTQGGLLLKGVYTVGSLPQALVVADVNEDGAPDIVTVNTLGNSVSVLLNANLADGSFDPTPRSFATGTEPRALAAGDLDNDGHLDLVTTNTRDNTISLLMNDGTGRFTLGRTLNVGAAPRGVVIEDLNNDGMPDIAVMNRGVNSVSVLINAYGSYAVSTYPTGSAPAALTAADVNGDGAIDLITANSGTKDLSVFVNNGKGGFGTPTTIQMYNVPTAVYAGDMTGDGLPELVVAQYSSTTVNNTVQVLTNTGNGTFARGDSIIVDSPVSVAGLDFNNKGVLHIAVPNLLTNRISLIDPALGQTPVQSAPAPDAINLKQPIVLQWQTTAHTTAYHLQVADVGLQNFIVNDTAVTASTYPLSALAFSTGYHWRVRSKNNIGWGDFSPWWSFSTCIAPPPAPELTLPAQCANDQAVSPLFVWHMVSTADAYRIQLSPDTLFGTIAVDAAAADTTWQSAPLNVHAKYFWRAKASNFGGESGWSPARSFVTLLPLPQTVALASPGEHASVGSASIAFAWHPAQWEVQKYWFEIATDSLFMFRIADTNVTDTTHAMQSLIGSQSYWWRVRALNAKGWGPFSALGQFSIGTLDVTPEGAAPLNYALEQNFPNPFNPSTQIRFSIAGTQAVRLVVFDLLGREVATLVNQTLQPGVYTCQWNARDNPTGVYFYRITAGTFTATKKLALQK